MAHSLKDALALHGIRKASHYAWGALDRAGHPFLCLWQDDENPDGRKAPTGYIRVNLWSKVDEAGMQTEQAKERKRHIAMLRAGTPGRAFLAEDAFRGRGPDRAHLNKNNRRRALIRDPWRIWAIVSTIDVDGVTVDALLRLEESGR